MMTTLVETVFGVGRPWWLDPEWRLRRSLIRALGQEAHEKLMRRGRAVGVNFATNELAICWRDGQSYLVFGFEDLLGAELDIDGHLATRVYRGRLRFSAPRRSDAEIHISLRLLFTDPVHPDFVIDLWSHNTPLPAAGVRDCLAEGYEWAATIGSLLRRSAFGLQATAPAAPSSRPDAAGARSNLPFWFQ